MPLPHNRDNKSHYIDLSQVASIVNRRFYRQGIQWAVGGFTLHTTATSGECHIFKVPSTWIASNAWEKSFRLWQDMINDSTSEAPSLKPRFLDFKVFADYKHHDLGVDANMLPASKNSFNNWTLANRGTWDMSSIHVPDSGNPGSTRERDLIFVGPNKYATTGASGNYAVSMIDGYAVSRALPSVTDPNMPAESADAAGSAAENWMQQLVNDGIDQDAEVIGDLIEENNQAPYPFEGGDDQVGGVYNETQYPGGQDQLVDLEFHDQMNVTSTTVSGKVTAVGGTFPCGLIKLYYSDALGKETDDLSVADYRSVLQIHLVPGSHRGYLCEPMTDM
jgi:hypothetical protein